MACGTIQWTIRSLQNSHLIRVLHRLQFLWFRYLKMAHQFDNWLQLRLFRLSTAWWSYYRTNCSPDHLQHYRLGYRSYKPNCSTWTRYFRKHIHLLESKWYLMGHCCHKMLRSYGHHKRLVKDFSIQHSFWVSASYQGQLLDQSSQNKKYSSFSS